MAQTGYTPILIYSSSTTTNAPAAGSLTNSTLGSELAINITDGKLFYKDNANAVQVIAWKTTPTTAGGTGLTSYTAGDLLYYATGTTLTKLAIGTSGRWLGSSGSAPQWNAPAALTKTDDTNVTLTLGGSASTALLNAASITVGWTGTLATSRGGTGLSSFTANGIAYASSTSALATGSALTFDGTNFATTGSATVKNLLLTSGTLPAANTPSIALRSSDNTIYYQSGSANTHVFLDKDQNTMAIIDKTNGVSVYGANFVVGTSGKGIDFSATAGTGTSELLNDYEEGTFTATFLSDGGSITTDATVRYGFYTKVGRQVTILCRVKASAISSPTGDAYVQGLPFTSASTTGLNGIATGYGLNFKNTLTTQMTGVIGASQTLLTLQKYAAGTTTGITADFNSNSEIYFSAVYFTA